MECWLDGWERWECKGRGGVGIALESWDVGDFEGCLAEWGKVKYIIYVGACFLCV